MENVFKLKAAQNLIQGVFSVKTSSTYKMGIVFLYHSVSNKLKNNV